MRSVERGARESTLPREAKRWERGRPTRGGGGGTAIYVLYRYVPQWRVWFSSSLLWDRVYKSESLGVEQGIIFQATDQLVEDFSLD